MSNIKAVQDIYAAFGRGDIPAILDRLADSIEWEYGFAPNEVPWLQLRRGRAEVGEFFESLNALEFHKFEPKTFLEGSGLVVALLNFEVTVKHTGKRIVEEDEAHIWHFDVSGQVIRFRHCLDTYQHVTAYRS